MLLTLSKYLQIPVVNSESVSSVGMIKVFKESIEHDK